MKHFAMLAAASTFLAIAGAGAASADECSGRSHDTGTVLGAAGGAAIGGLASHSVGGAVIGGVAGGLAGNAIARDQDCAKTEQRAEERAQDRAEDRGQAYEEGYRDRADEDRQALNQPRLEDDSDRAERDDYPR
jgi:uncharacterized protein YcfJ